MTTAKTIFQEDLAFLRAHHPCLFGYTIYELKQLFGSAPSDIAFHTKQLFTLVQEHHTSRISCLKAVHSMYNDSLENTQTVQDNFLPIGQCLRYDSGSYSLLSASYDPSTQRVIRVDLNQRMADLLGIPVETAPALLAAHGLAVPMPAGDCLCALIDAMLHQSASVVVRYFRFCSGYRRPCRAVLVCGTLSKTFNAVGQVVQVPLPPIYAPESQHLSAQCALTRAATSQVRYALRPISAGEYDAAVEATPHLCPLAAMGDLRTGRELLAHAAQDLADGPFPSTAGSAHCPQALLRRFLAARCAELQAQLRPCPAVALRGADSRCTDEAPATADCGCVPLATPQLESDGPAEEGASASSDARAEDAGDGGGWWARGPLRAFWDFGQRRAGLPALMDALPPAVKNELVLALDAADEADTRRTANAAAVSAALSAADAPLARGAAEAGPFADPAELWEAEAEWGYATAAFDPATGRRRPGSVRVNGRQASRSSV